MVCRPTIFVGCCGFTYFGLAGAGLSTGGGIGALTLFACLLHAIILTISESSESYASILSRALSAISGSSAESSPELPA